MFSLLIGYISFWQQGYSCAELKEQGLTKSGIYYLLIRGTSFWYIKVYCDMEAANGGWTVKKKRKISIKLYISILQNEKKQIDPLPPYQLEQDHYSNKYLKKKRV